MPDVPEANQAPKSIPTPVASLPGMPESPAGQSRAFRHLSILPSVFTSLNLFCGYLSILSTSREEYLVAGWLVVLALICDILDGRIARFTSVTSRFGAELDSLADLVSFGVAPAFLVFNRYLGDHLLVGLLATSVYVLCGALRLARFNITPPSDRDVFTGLPIPAGAGILCTLTIFEMQFFPFFRIPDFAIPFVVVLTGFLMVSTVEYPAMKKSKKTSAFRRLLAFVFIVALITMPALTLFLYSWGFASYGLFMWAFRRIFSLFRGKQPPVEPVSHAS
ncbi:MAG TPA: CDP-diacylglycerol--serine O-phosphatidyltransferase [Candidatus Ozemobacteraceae bacterium]